MRGRIFLKFVALTLLCGLALDVAVLALYQPYRRQQLVGEMAAEVGTLATRLARPLSAAAASGDAAGVRDLLGVFAGLPYLVCVDYHPGAGSRPVSWPQIGCERMRPGRDLAIPAPIAGAEAHYLVRLDESELAAALWREFAVLGALALAAGLAVVLAAAVVFHRIIQRPLHRLVQAMGRFERENLPQKVEWPARDEMGEAANRYNAMLDREVARVAELRQSRQQLAGTVTSLEEARDRAEQALDRLRRAQDRLVQTEKMASLGQLTAGIAHELKNPLNFVNNFAGLSRELLEELKALLEPGAAALEPAERAEMQDLFETLDGNLAKVAAHGGRADRIIRNMLLHARQDPGARSRTGLNDLLEESLGLAYHGARAEDPQLQVRIERELDPGAGEIEGWPQELQRVFVNLVSNSLYAMRRQQLEGAAEGYAPTLSVRTAGRPNEVEIRLRDNGTGIPPEARPKLFTPFFTTKPPGEGTGLGLSLSHDIVVGQHGGAISVDSEPGLFTEFTIVLPRRSADGDGAVAAKG